MSLEENEASIIWIWLPIISIVIYFLKLYYTKPPNFNKSVPTNFIASSKPDNPMINEIHITGIGNVPICCNQTARLGEAYCQCGRAVSKKLLNYYSPTPAN